MADIGLLALFLFALFLWLRHCHRRLTHLRLGFRCQLENLGATLTRRASSASELVTLARARPFGSPHHLTAFERAQRNANEAVPLLGQHPGDERAWAAFEQANARLGASREVLEEELANSGVFNRVPTVAGLMSDLARLDLLLFKQSQTAHTLASGFIARRKTTVGRVTTTLAALGLLGGRLT